MNALTKNPTADALQRLHRVAEVSDRALADKATLAAANQSMEDALAGIMAEEHRDYRKVYRGFADNFLSVSPAYGRFLYMMARTSGAKRIVEFGSSMGVSAIYLASALRDNGGGLLIGSEIETSKAVRSQFHLGAAGLGDLVEIRAGDALETLVDVGGPVDLLLLDGALSLYLPVLKLAEAWLRPGALVLAKKAYCPDYLAYVCEPANGYLSLPLPIDTARGNMYSVWAG